MKKTAIAVLAIIGLLLVSGGAVVVAHHGWWTSHADRMACDRFTVGETLPLTTLYGYFYNASNYMDRGTANGTFTLQVTQEFAQGCVVSITSGTFFLNSTSYSTTGGSIVMYKPAIDGKGTGTVSSGGFLISLTGLRGNSTKARASAISMDFNNGAGEFIIQLRSFNFWFTPRK